MRLWWIYKSRKLSLFLKESFWTFSYNLSLKIIILAMRSCTLLKACKRLKSTHKKLRNFQTQKTLKNSVSNPTSLRLTKWNRSSTTPPKTTLKIRKSFQNVDPVEKPKKISKHTNQNAWRRLKSYSSKLKHAKTKNRNVSFSIN